MKELNLDRFDPRDIQLFYAIGAASELNELVMMRAIDKATGREESIVAIRVAKGDGTVLVIPAAILLSDKKALELEPIGNVIGQSKVVMELHPMAEAKA